MTLHNIPTWYKGILYPSKTEANYAEFLDKEKAAGKVKWWRRQVPFKVEASGKTYTIITDFLVMRDREVIEETKNGLFTDEFIYKSQLWLEQFPNFPYYVIEPDGYAWRRTPLYTFIKPYLQVQATPTKQHTKTQIFLSKCFYKFASLLV